MGACSDSTITAPIGAPSARPSFNVSGTNPLSITSGASTQYCATQQLNGDTASAPLTFGPFLGCGAGTLDLGGNAVNPPTGNATIGSALAAYNPGWSAPFTGSDWIGITVTNGTPPVAGPSSDYRPNPGRYVFQEVFTIPANVINPVLDLHVKGDNVVGVYLNGKRIAAQANTDCNVAPCNWNIDTHVVDNTASDFHIGGNDTLTFRVIDLPTGYPVTTVGPVGGPAPQFGCPTRPFQANGMVGFTGGPVATSPGHVVVPGGAGTAMTNIGAANQAGCENPMGLDYAATMSWTRPVSTIWCSPGFWKNNGIDLWTSLQGLSYNANGPYPNDPQTFLGFDFGKKVGSQTPTLLQVIQNPSIYGGSATNNVASFISFKLFGTPESANPTENCPDVLPLGPG